MKNFMKKLSTIALLGFIISSPIFAIMHPSIHGGVHKISRDYDAVCPNPCPVSTTIDPAVTRNVTVIGAQGVLVQSCGTGDGCCCKSWNKKTGGEMQLTPVSKNTDGTYTLLSQNGYTRYYLADDSGSPIEGTVQLSNNFANATTWSFAEGSPNNIISDINGSIFTPLTQPAPVKGGGNSWFNWGSNPGTYEPQTFTPSGQFAGPSLVGSYDSKSQIATITDSSGKNIYTFINIKPYSQPVTPPTIMYPELNLVNIGSFPTPNWIDPRMKDGMIMLGGKIETTTLYGTLVSQKTPTEPVQPAAGSNRGTYGPQTFTPSGPYAGPGLVGNYFSSSKVATIHDPTQANPTSYTFDHIQSISTGGRAWPNGLAHIGSFPTPNFVKSNITCSMCPTGTTQLFGNLVPQDSAQ